MKVFVDINPKGSLINYSSKEKLMPKQELTYQVEWKRFKIKLDENYFYLPIKMNFCRFYCILKSFDLIANEKFIPLHRSAAAENVLCSSNGVWGLNDFNVFQNLSTYCTMDC